MRWGIGLAAILRGIVAVPMLMSLNDDGLLRFPWFAWMPAPTSALVGVILAFWFVSAITFTIGAATRTSGAVLCVTLAVSILLDQQAYSNHLLLLTILTGMLTLTEPAAALSVDAKRRGNELDVVPGWPVFLIKLQVTVVYLFAGATKFNDNFLSGAVINAFVGDGVIRPPESLLVPSVLSPLAMLAVLTELLIAVTLWRASLRNLGVLLGVGLHASIALLMSPTLQFTVFSMVMVSSYWVFMADSVDSTNEVKLRTVEPDSSDSTTAQPQELEPDHKAA